MIYICICKAAGMFPRKKGRLQMLEDSYLCEANIEAAQIMINKEWEKSKTIKNFYNRSLYLAMACLYPSSVLEHFKIIFLTHGGC